MNNIEKYRKLCKTEPTIPVFSKDWWMDATCGDSNWNVSIVEQNDEIIASLPYFINSRNGFKLLTMPRLTQKLGPWIKHPKNQKHNKRLSFEKRVMKELVENLPNFSYFSHNFDYNITNWLPFYWLNFNQTTKYTYVINSISNLEEVYSGFSKSLRNKIKNAEKTINITDDFTLKDFYYINKMTFERQGLKIPYSFDYLKRIDQACVNNNSRKMFFATYEGELITAIYVIWDKTSAYLLMSGSDPQYRNLNAKTLLVWNAINYLSDKTKRFDFEGSMIENIADYNKSFGAIQTPYYSISKTNSFLLKIRNGIKEVRKK